MKQILVIAAPGRLQEGLQALLATLSDTDVVVVADASAAQTQVVQCPPQLVISTGGDAAGALAALAEACAGSRFLLLVEQARDKAAAEAAGADIVLVEGTPAGRLLDVVRDLLADVSAGQMEE
jgi:NAD(P)H-dependent flavin oxidoreductase YrpB (nitropropane dioxygenase family)